METRRRSTAHQPEGIYYRPYVIYNARTRKYVLWYNWYKKTWDGQYGVATSDRPQGPFTIQSGKVPSCGPIRATSASWSMTTAPPT